MKHEFINIVANKRDINSRGDPKQMRVVSQDRKLKFQSIDEFMAKDKKSEIDMAFKSAF